MTVTEAEVLAQEFGARVRELRTRRGMQQAELARMMTDAGHQMHQTTVAKLEAGSRPTSVPEVHALARILATSPDLLISGPARMDEAEDSLPAAVIDLCVELRGAVAEAERALAAAATANRDADLARAFADRLAKDAADADRRRHALLDELMAEMRRPLTAQARGYLTEFLKSIRSSSYGKRAEATNGER